MGADTWAQTATLRGDNWRWSTGLSRDCPVRPGAQLAPVGWCRRRLCAGPAHLHAPVGGGDFLQLRKSGQLPGRIRLRSPCSLPASPSAAVWVTRTHLRLLQSEQDVPEPQARAGRLYLYSCSDPSACSVAEMQRRDTSAILDMKWYGLASNPTAWDRVTGREPDARQHPTAGRAASELCSPLHRPAHLRALVG